MASVVLHKIERCATCKRLQPHAEGRCCVCEEREAAEAGRMYRDASGHYHFLWERGDWAQRRAIGLARSRTAELVQAQALADGMDEGLADSAAGEVECGINDAAIEPALLLR